MALAVKTPPANAKDRRDASSIPGVRNGSPVQYSCLGNPMVGYSPWGCKRSNMTEQPSPWYRKYFRLSY